MQPGINVHTKRTSSSLSISLVADFFFLISVRSHSVAFSLLYKNSILHLQHVSSFLLSSLLSPLSRSHAEGWARGAQYTKACTHTKTQLAQSSARGGMQRASRKSNRDILLRLKTSCRFSMNLIDVCGSDGLRRSRNVCVRVCWLARSQENANGLRLDGDRCQSATTSPRLASLCDSPMKRSDSSLIPSGNVNVYRTLHGVWCIFNIKKWKTLALQALSSRYTHNTG